MVLRLVHAARDNKCTDLLSIDENLPSIDENLPSIDENLPSIDENLPSIDENLPSIDENLTSIDEHSRSITDLAQGVADDICVLPLYLEDTRDAALRGVSDGGRAVDSSLGLWYFCTVSRMGLEDSP